ncbi:hypothetical protein E2C01_007466 [Portunus trituberculatus]|uniref:Uncharacterized protein n=1 Tax=Portunus trituberculatus TaxID=210409 RepID=A0A5B7D080_PORTR|nr:hypothetical protein [Portunus trituberculatus]
MSYGVTMAERAYGPLPHMSVHHRARYKTILCDLQVSSSRQGTTDVRDRVCHVPPVAGNQGIRRVVLRGARLTNTGLN